MSSNHIIRLWDSESSLNFAHCYIVDLLIRDEDMYFHTFDVEDSRWNNLRQLGLERAMDKI
jgi:hypothetical protein